MESEDNGNDNSTSNHTVIWVSVALIALPILYVLSTGPAYFLFLKSGFSPRLLDMFYTPLIWIHDNNMAFQDFIDWYFRLCRVYG